MIITSSANPLVKRIRKLHDRKQRRIEGVFLVEGVQPVWRAVDAGADIEMLVIAPQLIDDRPAARLIEDFESGGGAVARVSADVFATISDREGPTGVAAIVRRPTAELDQLHVTADSVFVGLFEIANPGNLGTIVRTADSFGVTAVVLIGTSADPYSPAAVKASMGSLFALPVVHAAAIEDLFQWADRSAITTVTTSARAAAATPDVAFPKPSLVVFGSEGGGLPVDVLERSDLAVRIPLRGTASSLNLAVAAGILLYLATA